MFVSGIERTVAWARTYQRALLIGAVALIVLVAVVLYYVNVQRAIENQAAERFTQLQATIASGNTQLAIRDLQTFVDRFGSTESGQQGRLILGEILLREGQAPQAVDALGDLADDPEDATGTAAARIKAAAYEAMGQQDEAVSLYVRIAGAARFDYQAREALADAARVRLQNGDADAAAALYGRVLDTFAADDPGRGYYEMWLAEARARADQPGTAPAAAETTPAGAGAAPAGTAGAAAADTAQG